MNTQEILNKAGEIISDRSKRCKGSFYEPFTWEPGACRRHLTEEMEAYCLAGAVEHVAKDRLYSMNNGSLRKTLYNVLGIDEYNHNVDAIYDLWDEATPEEQDAIAASLKNYVDPTLQVQDQAPTTPA